MLNLNYGVPAELARHATLDELRATADNIAAWDERQSEVLDFIYRYRLIRLLTNRAAPSELQALNDHLARVAHDGRQTALDTLSIPYHARWTAYREILEDRIAALESSVAEEVVNGYAHVADILALVTQQDGIGQQQIQQKLKLGKVNLSRILNLMEAQELIARRKSGRHNQIVPGANAARFTPPQPLQVKEPKREYAVTPNPADGAAPTSSHRGAYYFAQSAA